MARVAKGTPHSTHRNGSTSQQHRRHFNCMRVAEYPGQEPYRALGTGLFTEAALMAAGFKKFEPRHIAARKQGAGGTGDCACHAQGAGSGVDRHGAEGRADRQGEPWTLHAGLISEMLGCHTDECPLVLIGRECRGGSG